MRSTDEMTIVRTIDRIKQSSLIDQVGNTPLIPLRKVRGELAKSVKIYVKAEWHNPGGSVKDRPAAAIIQHALDGGLLDNSVQLLDSTSGNMGISYATLAATLGIKVHLTIPANAHPTCIGGRTHIDRSIGRFGWGTNRCNRDRKSKS